MCMATAMFALVHHREYVAPLPAGHRFPMSKYGLLLPALGELEVEYKLHMPAPMPRAAIEAVHEAVLCRGGVRRYAQP